LPSVRARRIKTLEAERRKWEREEAEALDTRRSWFAVAPLTHKVARLLANYAGLSFYRRYPLAEFPRAAPVSTYEGDIGVWSALGDTPEEAIITPAYARLMVGRGCVRAVRHARRWLAHLDNRLGYERAMQAAAGGTVADKTGPEKGGAVKCWASPAFGRGWAIVQKVNRVSVTVLDTWGNGGRDFTRTIPFDKLAGVMTRAEVDAARAAGRLDMHGERGFILRDTPAPQPEPAPAPLPFRRSESGSLILDARSIREAREEQEPEAAAAFAGGALFATD
ncbi:MAG TPA: hypothetical protein VD866_32635, partial [Urbifossiella sp.]|nr:hypothetical protein [Urbifossiella sp.]